MPPVKLNSLHLIQKVGSRGTAAKSMSRYRRQVPTLTTSQDAADAVDAVARQCEAWHALPVTYKISVLEDMLQRCIKASVELGRGTAEVLGTPAKMGKAHNEEAAAQTVAQALLLGFAIKGHLGVLQRQVEDASEFPPAAEKVRTTAGGSAVFKVQPHPAAITLGSSSGEVELYLQPGAPDTQGVKYMAAHQAPQRGACVVLGAGNQPFLSVNDVLHKMFVENFPVVLKHHEAQASNAEVMEYILEPLTITGCYRGFLCERQLTSDLLYAERVSDAHMTGSLRVHDLLVWGRSEEQESRKSADNPKLSCGMSSELGAVTPCFVVPGSWSEPDLKGYAGLIAENAFNNAGCNCLALKVVFLASEWPQAAQFESLLRSAIADVPAQPAWYPGAVARHGAFQEAHSGYGCELVDMKRPPGVSASDYSQPLCPPAVAFANVPNAASVRTLPGVQEEYFAPVLLVVRVDCVPGSASARSGQSVSVGSDQAGESGAADSEHSLAKVFLAMIPELGRSTWGNLTCAVLVPSDVQDALSREVEAAVDDLEFGNVVVNGPTYASYPVMTGMWGAFQSQDTSMVDPRSGVGHIHNTLLFDSPQKQVLRIPFGNISAPASSLRALPLWLAKGIGALTLKGWSGLWTAMWP